MLWLQAHGIIPRKGIPIRSSDFFTIFGCEFAFYLRSILGLSSSFRVSKALARGSWFHKRLEFLEAPPELGVPLLMDSCFETRTQELKDICSAWGFDSDTIRQTIENEAKDFKTAWAWYEATRTIKLPASTLGCPLTFEEFLRLPHLRLLGVELKAVYNDPNFAGHPFVGVFDRLYHDRNNNQLWILDAKTADKVPSVRLATVHIDFQTQHYLHILSNLLRVGLIHQAFPDLPPDVTVGGMAHLCIQKPTINFDRRVDRPFEWRQKVISRGPRKGQIEMEKDYKSDEPVFDLYVERVKRWYAGEGEYISDAIERQTNLPVNMSFTSLDMALDDDGFLQYSLRLERFRSVLSRPPYPNQFIKNPSFIEDYKDLSVFAPFYLRSPAFWPDVIRQHRLISSFRDEHINESSPDSIS